MLLILEPVLVPQNDISLTMDTIILLYEEIGMHQIDLDDMPTI